MKRLGMLVGLLMVVGCASTKPVDLKESRRVVGTENDVRIDAEVFGDRLGPAMSLPINYDITNHREKTILIADLLPDSQYDPETLTVTITIGTEIPGEQYLPRLIPIAPGERKSFHSLAKIAIMSPVGLNPYARRPSAVRIRVNFLDDVQSFQKLIAIPEKAVHDPQLAELLFNKWVEGNESVTTNALPMRWTGGVTETTPAAPPARRGRRGV